MTAKQAATIVSRAFCLWFAYEAFTRLSAIPTLIYSTRMITMMNAGIGSGSGSIVTGRYHAYPPSPLLMLGSSLIGMTGIFTLIADIALAIIFYRCGPHVVHFFIGKQADPEETT